MNKHSLKFYRHRSSEEGSPSFALGGFLVFLFITGIIGELPLWLLAIPVLAFIINAALKLTSVYANRPRHVRSVVSRYHSLPAEIRDALPYKDIDMFELSREECGKIFNLMNDAERTFVEAERAKRIGRDRKFTEPLERISQGYKTEIETYEEYSD